MIEHLSLFNNNLLFQVSNYIDPGSLSAVMAVVIGAIAGAGMTFKLYWFKIKEKFSRKG